MDYAKNYLQLTLSMDVVYVLKCFRRKMGHLVKAVVNLVTHILLFRYLRTRSS
jgi:hypothetical protein